VLLFAPGSLFSTAYGTSLMVVLSLSRPALGRNAWFGCRHTNDRNRRSPAARYVAANDEVRPLTDLRISRADPRALRQTHNAEPSGRRNPLVIQVSCSGISIVSSSASPRRKRPVTPTQSPARCKAEIARLSGAAETVPKPLRNVRESPEKGRGLQPGDRSCRRPVRERRSRAARGRAASLLRHPRLAQAGEIGLFEQGSDLWRQPPISAVRAVSP
jgi:hypothetical protein